MIKGSIILVPFPFDDFSNLKQRPALCLTNEIGKHRHIIVAFISSQLRQNLLDSDIPIVFGSENWKCTGLRSDSIIRLHRIISIPRSLIKRKIGFINNVVKVEVEKKISLLFFK